MILAALGRQLPASALLMVQPATILGWHRALVRRRWSAFGRRRSPGRPPLPAGCQELVLRLARENPLWGYVRVNPATAPPRSHPENALSRCLSRASRSGVLYGAKQLLSVGADQPSGTGTTGRG